MHNPYKLIYELRETIAELSEQCREQEEEIEELQKAVPQWISVKDRLPESIIYDCPCLLVTDGSLIHMAYFVENEWIFADSGQAKDKMFYEVTHWMPLPETPESEDDAE